jgi:phenylpyruvate tautomerase PptA (4-oxalocrotonate tautomerase family)
MPLLEVMHASQRRLSRDRKRAFIQETVEIFREVLGTPPGRLRVVIHHLEPEDTTNILIAEG